MSKPTCPGLYCGRALLDTGEWSDCGTCPRGFRANATSHCLECSDQPLLYDWLYLGFMALLPLALNWFFIDMVSAGWSVTKAVVVQHVCALFEVCAGATVALLISSPMGSLSLKMCRPQALSDWYTLLHNPQPRYKEVLHCTQEAVYPLYTIVLVMYGLSLLLMLVCRPWLAVPAARRRGIVAIYCALYFYPILVTIHALAAGLIYYSFPYIIIILSMMSSASHFSAKANQSPMSLFITSVTDVRNIIILLGHWVMHGYGIISITGFKDHYFDWILLALVPTPAAFYILTSHFTDPMKLHID